jgi:hypothetical protein
MSGVVTGATTGIGFVVPERGESPSVAAHSLNQPYGKSLSF